MLGCAGVALDVGRIVPKPPGDSHEGSARPEHRDEVRHPPVGLLQDLRRGRVVMRMPVRGVVVLVRIEILVRFARVNLPHDFESHRPILRPPE